uniref:Uncharacterized protein n=1 Tax=Podoviridae sp. ctIi724 TaxID=2827731 RepID=A0A8S5SR97_9CAUD|nr:MAG TPA: hypothetical protein [Podoviridae sp. ctIi724]
MQPRYRQSGVQRPRRACGAVCNSRIVAQTQAKTSNCPDGLNLHAQCAERSKS